LKPSETLALARAKINTPEKWTQRVFARDSAGRQCGDGSPDARCWCLLGALNSLYAPYFVCPDTVLRYVHLAIGDDPIDAWNDAAGRSHHEVLAALSRACAIAIAEGQ